MIGVIAKDSEEKIVREFFELFKTPWEFLKKGSSYDIIITTDSQTEEADARLVIIYNSGETRLDKEIRVGIKAQKDTATLRHDNDYIPIYKKISIFDEVGDSLVNIAESQEVAGVRIAGDDKNILRIGYDLFEEVGFLITHSQPEKHAHIPTIELHISMLRDWILKSGLPLVEIPPVPAGHPFMSCITHDVDFVGIRNHKFDHTFFGFIFRALFVSSLDFMRSKTSLSKLLRNLRAVVSLPLVYLGLLRDFWSQFDRYMKIEEDICSTYYFIPFKGHPGDIDTTSSHPHKNRSAKYEINEYKTQIENLINKGNEVGLHGIDAWHDATKGRDELQVMRHITGNDDLGVRMHWLYYSDKSPSALKEAGFLYDSTLGYNGAVGYRSGTTQVFRLSGYLDIFELPLNVMDTAMFYPMRMGLTEADAIMLCKKLIRNFKTYGGVFTINWHQRSLAPERCWDNFYSELLQELKSENALFVTATQAVKWFEARRSVQFGDISYLQNKIKIRLHRERPYDGPRLLIRVHHPQNGPERSANCSRSKQPFVDIAWNGESEVEYAL